MLRWAVVSILFAAALSAQQPAFDLLIEGGRIVDGAGNPWFLGDVGVRGDTIASMGNLSKAAAKVRIDARGLVVAPGFIDIHSHGGRGIFAHPAAENLIRQGVTSILEGNDGSSPLPVGAYLDKLAATKFGVNFGLFVGHGTLRREAVGLDNRRATEDEVAKMRALAAEAMKQGAFGLSTGLFYVPGNYAPTEEVIAIAKTVGELGGMHISHMRDEAAGSLDSVRETIRIGEEGGLPTQVSHHKIIGTKNWGLSTETLRLVSEARARGVDVTVDQYAYTASSTGTGALFPQWSMAGGPKAFAERLQAPEQRARIKQAITDAIVNGRGGGDPKNVVLASCGFDRSLAGKSLGDLAAGADAVAEKAIELQLKGGCSAVYHAIREDDIERILAFPFTMVASDGGIPTFGDGVPHPRNYGAFARVLGRYVRERKILTLEEAVHRMSGFPAQRLKLYDRGLLRPGMKADIAVFDPATIIDRAEFTNPHQYAEGVRHVLVNGRPALLNGKMTGDLGGRVLYGPAK
ncbi:MAG TPA: N-acyl-D-amino-acid deacylase [Solibacterales bacterium]|nr:N-acyl-D-amino-acid deacylase [Bryobacterales bacterium]